MTKTEIQKNNNFVRGINKRNQDKLDRVWKINSKKCPSCGKPYTEHPALSRKDNKTEICPKCGIEEAMLDYLKNVRYNKKFIY